MLSRPDVLGNRQPVIQIASFPANWFARPAEGTMDAKAQARGAPIELYQLTQSGRAPVRPAIVAELS
jgi:hypothetical protein